MRAMISPHTCKFLLSLALVASFPSRAQGLDGCHVLVPPPWESVQFDVTIQSIFDRSCVDCHQPGGQGFAQHQLDLRPGFSYRSLVGRHSAQNPSWTLVQPFNPDAGMGSLLWWKLSCAPPPVGGPMPPASQSLTASEIRAIYIWILRGAPPGESGTGSSRAIEVGHSGSWYDPSLAGHGFSFEVVPGESSLFIVYWMTFGLGGQSQWLVGLGEFEGGASTVELGIFRVSGGVFDAAQFRPTDRPIGNARLSFSDCNEATLHYDIQLDSSDQAPRQTRTVALRRLTPPQHCNQGGN